MGMNDAGRRAKILKCPLNVNFYAVLFACLAARHRTVPHIKFTSGSIRIPNLDSTERLISPASA